MGLVRHAFGWLKIAYLAVVLAALGNSILILLFPNAWGAIYDSAYHLIQWSW